MPTLFLSHAHTDFRIAKRLQDLLEDLSGHGFEVSRSSEKGQIKSGENWRAWIDDKILRCDVAIILLTPSSLRGRWVLWEAGAVAGVQYERTKDVPVTSNEPAARRVRVLRFNLKNADLGPFGNNEGRNALDQEEMVTFVSELLTEFSSSLDSQKFQKGMRTSEKKVDEFIAGVREDLRYSSFQHDEGVVQEWIARLDGARERKDDRWIVAAKRWINVAFLGANNADAHKKGEAIDFRIHTRIAEAHRRLGEWESVVEQLQLAAQLSPNDLVVLRDLGRAQRALGRLPELEQSMKDMQLLDPDIFKTDREGITLRCGYFAKLDDWPAVEKLLGEAASSIVSQDPYLANWHAIATMKARSAVDSTPMFQRLRDLLMKTGQGFWDDATLVNALLALKDPEAAAKLRALGLPQRPKDEIASATRFYDDIVSAFGNPLNWRDAAGVTTAN
jgi:hypothetical protein